MSSLIKHTALGLSFKKQTALQTASVDADIQRVSKLNAAVSAYDPVNEDDSKEIGTGTEFATQLFKTSAMVSGSIEKYLSSEMAAWMFAFGLGNTTETAAGTTGKKYTSVPSDVCAGLDMPAFTVVEQIGKDCSPVVLDRAFPGCVLEDFSISISSGPGRQSSKLTANFVGCGKMVKPSGITLPSSPLAEHLLPASSATVTINGVDYVTNKNLLSLTFGFKNNILLDQGYYIGSGVDNGYAIRGRMEHGTRQVSFGFTARFDGNSTELDKLMNLTTGTAVLQLTGPQIEAGQNHSLKLTLAKIAFTQAVIGDDSGIVTVNVTCSPLYDAVNGIVSAEVVTTADIS